MKLLITQFSPDSCYFLPLRYVMCIMSCVAVTDYAGYKLQK